MPGGSMAHPHHHQTGSAAVHLAPRLCVHDATLENVRTPAWLGVDVGTSSLKVLVVGADGSPLAEQETAWALQRPGPRMVETDPRVWTQAVDDVLVPMSAAYDVRAIGVTGQMHGTILVDETGAAVRPAVLWPDSRAEAMRPLWDALPEMCSPVSATRGRPA